jgi:hypothetical protein
LKVLISKDNALIIKMKANHKFIYLSYIIIRMK